MYFGVNFLVLEEYLSFEACLSSGEAFDLSVGEDRPVLCKEARPVACKYSDRKMLIFNLDSPTEMIWKPQVSFSSTYITTLPMPRMLCRPSCVFTRMLRSRMVFSIARFYSRLLRKMARARCM